MRENSWRERTVVHMSGSTREKKQTNISFVHRSELISLKKKNWYHVKPKRLLETKISMHVNLI